MITCAWCNFKSDKPGQFIGRFYVCVPTGEILARSFLCIQCNAKLGGR
ncbi:hypothetical protein MGMO_41c00330 [Methyloglobulus morosus KoM1]|uniref:Uncharacterized protein n=1 Tax=Methyloglobulus morosus KoM1 TaxID=1116472 RepID=V5E088_9GAMM|nr:hypothetical protein MGMO_41c00330 [Methyloglobulus morosus KoM1]